MLLSFRLLSKNFKIKIYKLILSVEVYDCEMLSLTLREKRMLRIFEKRTQRKFGPKKDTNMVWRRLHIEELHSLYRAPNMVRVIKSRR